MEMGSGQHGGIWSAGARSRFGAGRLLPSSGRGVVPGVRIAALLHAGQARLAKAAASQPHSKTTGPAPQPPSAFP